MYCFISPEDNYLSLKIGTKSFKEDRGGEAACTFQRSDSRQEDFLRTCSRSAASGAALRGEAWKSAGLSLRGSRGDHCEDTAERIFQCDARPPSPPQPPASSPCGTFGISRQRFARRAVLHTFGCSALAGGWKLHRGVVDLSGKIKRMITMMMGEYSKLE